MNNLRQACQHGGFNFLYLEPIQNIKIISCLCPSDRILVYDELGTNPLQNDCLRQKRVHAVRVLIEVQGLFIVSHQYLWGFGMDSKFCSHDVFIELGHHLLNTCFGVHIFTLLKSLDIRKLHDIPWVQEKSKLVVVFCWFFNLNQRRKDIGKLVLYPRPHLGMYLR